MSKFSPFSRRHEECRIGSETNIRRVTAGARILLFWAAALVVTVRPVMADQAPIGWLDVANCEVISGWALDQDTPSTSIEIHLYDGPAGAGGVFINNYPTDHYRGDVNAAYNVEGNHGFHFQIPAQFLDGGTHYVYVYGINSNGEGPNPTLEGVGVSVNCPPPSSSPSCTLSANPTDFVTGNSTVLSWTTNNADAFAINQGIGNVTPVAGGSFQHWPPVVGSLTYTGTATGASGSANCYATVNISSQAPSSYTFLIRGTASEGTWTLPGSAMSNAVAATYGYAPQPWVWADNSLAETFPPLYVGIFQGGQELANFINNLPAGDVNLISHSHGGNVVLIAQFFGIRPVRRYIQLAVPVNWDFWDWRYAIAYGQVVWRCQVSATRDWIQFFGASPSQVNQFAWEIYTGEQAVREGMQAAVNGDWELAYYWFSQATIDLLQADFWFDSAKIEFEGTNLVFDNVPNNHFGVHEPIVWNAMNAVAPSCA